MSTLTKIWLSLACVFATAALVAQQQDSPAAKSEAPSKRAMLLTISGAIGPATRDYIVGAIEDASAGEADLVILQIDTPGGLDASTRDIVRAILNASVPVATYVAPEGARAASAGTYILLASHVAAMSQATNIGAATPISLIGGSSPPVEDGEDNAESPEGEEETSEEAGESGEETRSQKKSATADAMSRKVLNDSVAYIRGLAERHGRNADWAELAVREADSITSEEALTIGVIDLMADSVDDLLAQLDGREVMVKDETITLDTAEITLIEREPNWRHEFLAAITDPTIAYILLLIGFYGLVLEGYHPGAIVPGVVGAISLLLALYALQMLPVNYAGLALIILGVLLIIAETLAPSFGALGIGGVISLVIGSIILIDTDVPGFAVSRTLIGAIALASSLLLLGVIMLAIRARRRPVVAGREELLGADGVAAEAFAGTGLVWVRGERWNARSNTPLNEGQRVEVTGIDGLTLIVTPSDQDPDTAGETPPEEDGNV